ncbi:MAG: DUF6391 domain-containing protein [Candidatus Sumerlaeia bacterium]|nr:DUF6391 domain-containing protein [Candidatus Sumerlaeia bacterium]
MELIILILVLLLLAPGSLKVLVIPLIIAVSIILFVSLLFRSVATVVLVPRSLLLIAFNRRLRQNHSLEHATVNVIEEEVGKTNISGYAVKDGFKLYCTADMPPEFIYQAAQIGLARLKSGEHNLAIHPRCGSSLLMTHFLFSVLVIAIFVGFNYLKPVYIITALVVINLLSRPLGALTQKFITTSPRVNDMVITELEVRTPTGNPIFRFFFREFYVHTERRQPVKFRVLNHKSATDVIPLSSG